MSCWVRMVIWFLEFSWKQRSLKQSPPHISLSHPPLVAIYSPEKCCRVTGELVICWVGQSIPRRAEEKDKSQGFAFSSSALGCGPPPSSCSMRWGQPTKKIDLKRGTDLTQPCPKPHGCHSTLWAHNTFIWYTDFETHTSMHPYFSKWGLD